MLATLEPLHAILQQGAETSREESFQQAFGNELRQAHERCERFRRSQSRAELHAAWDIYYQAFRRISKQVLLVAFSRSRRAPRACPAAADIQDERARAPARLAQVAGGKGSRAGCTLRGR